MLGCAVSWHITARPDGVWLMQPWGRRKWVGPGPRLTVVAMAPASLERVRARLRRFWAGRRVILSPDNAERMLAAVQDALNGRNARKELQWAVDLLSCK